MFMKMRHEQSHLLRSSLSTQQNLHDSKYLLQYIDRGVQIPGVRSPRRVDFYSGLCYPSGAHIFGKFGHPWLNPFKTAEADEKNKQGVVRETKLSRRGKKKIYIYIYIYTALKISKKYRSSFWKKGDQKQGKALGIDEISRLEENGWNVFSDYGFVSNLRHLAFRLMLYTRKDAYKNARVGK